VPPLLPLLEPLEPPLLEEPPLELEAGLVPPDELVAPPELALEPVLAPPPLEPPLPLAVSPPLPLLPVPLPDVKLAYAVMPAASVQAAATLAASPIRRELRIFFLPRARVAVRANTREQQVHRPPNTGHGRPRVN
jgi:hypothetical protein